MTLPRPLLACLLALLAAPPSRAESVDAIRLPAVSKNASASGPAREPILSGELGLAPGRAVPLTTLDAVDEAALLAEDAAADGRGMRTGIRRETDVRRSAGSWEQVAGGWLWSADLRSTGAKAMRVHFTSFDLPPGARAQVHGLAVDADPAPAYEARGGTGDGAFWTPIAIGEEVRVEYFAPGEGAAPPDVVPFIVDEVIHMYRSPFGADPGDEIHEFPCHNDVMCTSGWDNERDATARIDFVTSTGSKTCTAVMLNTLQNDFTPYLMTANHCISTASEAMSAEVVWGFQHTSCGGGIGVTKSSFRCSVLATEINGDYTLLMIDGIVPTTTEVAWAGWDTNGVGFFTNVTGIHHPAGTFKRISFGSTQAPLTVCQGGSDTYTGVIWSNGITEQGSSGSGLFNNITRHYMGPLSCESIALNCDNPNLPAAYGRFPYSYQTVGSMLAAGSDDAQEGPGGMNDFCDFARPIAAGSYPGLVVKRFDDDWYYVDPGIGDRVTFSIHYFFGNGDVDLELYRTCGGTPLWNTHSNLNDESIDYVSPDGAPLYFRAFLASDVRANYDLTVAIQLASNLNALVSPAGFDRPLVPRNAPDVSVTAAVPPTLTSDPASALVGSTWLNFSVWQSGPGVVTPAARTNVYRDVETEIDGSTVPNGAGPGYYKKTNSGPHVFLGGRHTLTMSADVLHQVAESDESDNVWSGQYVWSPVALTNQVPTYVSRKAPHPGYSGPANCEGFRGSGFWWGSVGMIQMSAADDYDLALYNDYTGGSLSGFQNALAVSPSFAGATEFVIWNGNRAGFGAAPQVGVVRFAAPSGQGYLVQQSNEVSSTFSLPTAYDDSYLTPVTTIDSLDVLKLHEVYMDAGAGITYTFTLENLSGVANLNVSLYDQAGTWFGKYNSIATSAGAGGGGNETFDYRPNVSGWYVVAVWKNDTDDRGKKNTYQLRVGPARSNLSEWITSPGWDAVVVPTNLPWFGEDGVTVSPTLDGGGSWLHWLVGQLGPNPVPNWATEAWLDEEQLPGTYDPGAITPPGTYLVRNHGPHAVRGGRHTLTVFADIYDAVQETIEYDNRADRQLIWSPLELYANAPRERGRPPASGYGGWFNSDGFHFQRNPGEAWVVSAAPADADVDLWVATDYVGSTSGFSNFPVYSLQGGNGTDFCVGHSSGTPVDLYPEVTHGLFGLEGGSFMVDASTSEGRDGPPGSSWLGQVMGPGRVADVYQVYLTHGFPVYVTLRRTSGSGPLGLEAFNGFPGTMGGRGWGLPGTQLTDDLATVAFTAGTDGWHPLVVYRREGAGASLPLTYDLRTSSQSPLGADPPPASYELAFAGAVPNPTRGGARFEFALREAGRVRVSVYDLGGRRVRTVLDDTRGAGRYAERWDGRDESGHAVDAGLYWARLETGGRTLTRRVVLLQ